MALMIVDAGLFFNITNYRAFTFKITSPNEKHTGAKPALYGIIQFGPKVGLVPV